MHPIISEVLRSVAAALCSMLVAAFPLSIYFFFRMDGADENVSLLKSFRYVPGIFAAQIFYGFHYYLIGALIFRFMINSRKVSARKHHLLSWSCRRIDRIFNDSDFWHFAQGAN